MSTITVRNRPFQILLTAREIANRLEGVASEFRKLYAEEDVVFIVILKGSLFVASDLIRAYGLPCSLEAVRAMSYKGMKSSGVVEITMTENLKLKDKTVIIIEDIVETGRTLQAVHFHLRQQKPKKLITFTLLRKPTAFENPIAIDHVGFDINQAFVIGYGLDYDEEARQLKDIYQLVEDE